LGCDTQFDLTCGCKGSCSGHPVLHLKEDLQTVSHTEDEYWEPTITIETPIIREFATGATRDKETGKLDFEGFLSPQTLTRFGEYMNKHRLQSNGTLRDSDNWQLGMPRNVYMKSMWRHFVDVWAAHRKNDEAALEEALCAVWFNVQGYLFEILNKRSV
jgi:hypothetical protein